MTDAAAKPTMRVSTLKPQPELSTQEVLAGVVERVTYHNAENGFCVLRATARGHRDVVTIVGHAATIAAGEWITASGEWVNDRTLGSAADNLKRPVTVLGDPGLQMPGIAAVTEDAPDPGEEPACACQQGLGPVPILDVAGVDMHRKPPALRIGQDVTIAPIDLLARITPTLTPFWSPIRTLWLSMIAAVGLGCRPARSRSAMSRA
jgi:hypothetical protein